MAKVVSVAYTRAGTARRSGRGLSIEISGAQYFITPEDIPALMYHYPVAIVDQGGEREGTAWLSPIIDPRKRDLTALIQQHLYVIGYRDLSRILDGQTQTTPVMEYQPV
ncbi:MAG: hypothetical protein LUO81_03170 [Methanoregulaceae archaeon]|nr:hypothetical protein [Methanoregulaceae archaeon]